MKKILLLAAVVFSVAACKKAAVSSHTSIVGKWKLSEYLADPGDGSGTWQPANKSNPQYLEFKDGGELIITPITPGNTFTWDHYQLTSDSTLLFVRGSDKFPRWYHFSPTLLSISGGCYEACGERYIPVK